MGARRFELGWSLAVTAALAVTLTLIAASAEAATVKETFEKYDLLGTLASDCSKPADAKTPYLTNRIIDANHVQLDRMIGPTNRQLVTIVDGVLQAKPNELTLSATTDDKPRTIVFQVDRGRVRAMESTTDKGEKAIAGGHYTNGGAETPWFSRCVQKFTIRNVPEWGGKCVEVVDGDIKAGKLLQTWDCNETPPQIFAYDTLNERLAIGDFCVDTVGGRSDQGVDLVLAPCNGGQTQNFKIQASGTNAKILGVGGFCMAIESEYKGVGAAIHLWQCGGWQSQVWQLVPALDLTWEEATNRDGSHVGDFVLAGSDPKFCQLSCVYDRKCSSWVYRKPEGRSDHKPHCWLLDKTTKVTTGDGLQTAGSVRPEPK